MFCSNCGKEMADGMRFCPACGAPTGGDAGAGVQAFGQPEVQGKGISVENDFEALRQVVEKGNRSEKVWKNIGRILAFLYLILIARGLVNGVKSVLDGNAGIWYAISGVAALVLLGCGLAYIFQEIVLPAVKVRKAFLAEEYLKLIHVENSQDLLKTLEQLKCSAIKRSYMDENGKVCVQGRKTRHTFEVREGALVLISGKENYKTALERETIAGSLLKFLAPDAPVNAFEKEQSNARLSRRNKILAAVAVISGALALFGILNPDSMGGQQKYIRMVKETAPQSYPDITYGEAFEAFFGNGRWNYFKSEDEQDVVEFHGNCYYDEKKVEVVIQYLVSYEEGTWQLYAMTMNDVPQTELMQLIMLETIFESYETGDGSQDLQLEEPENGANADTDAGERNVAEESNTAGENDADTANGQEASQQDTLEYAETQQDTADYTAGIIFPILEQCYTDSNSLCPVMLNMETEDGSELISGTYEEMLASCINDGFTMYASPVMYDGSIYTATRWDALPDRWYDGLLTYDQFLSAVEWMCQTYAETGAESIYTSASWDMVDALSGRWSDEIYNISISIYSDASFYEVYDEIGTFDMKGAGVSGTVELLGHSGEDLYVLCRTADGARMELRYTSDGMLEVKSVSEEYGIEENTCLTCIQRFES